MSIKPAAGHSASVKAVYGNEFNSRRYLLRFFDRTFRFREIDTKTFIANLFESNGIDPKDLSTPRLESVNCTARYFEAFDLSLRDMEQCFEIFATVRALWDHPVPLQLPLLWPLICTHHQGQLEGFETLRGKARKVSIPELFPNDVGVLSHTERNLSVGTLHHVHATVRNLTEAYLHGYTTALHELTVQPGTSVAHGIANEYFTYELSKLHSNRYDLNSPPFSVVSEYADYVKLALQFKSSETLGNE